MQPPLRVVYVASSSHSGSTLLALLADEHPGVASVGETAIKPKIRREGRAASQHCSCGAPLQQCELWGRVFQQVSNEGIRFNANCWSNDYRFENKWLDAMLTRETSLTILRRVRRATLRHLPRSAQRMARIDRANVSFIKAVLAQTGATVFVDTTKLLTRLSYLLEIPDLDVKIVHLVRDVRGFAASGKRRGVSVERAARVWRNDQRAIQAMVAAVPGERTLMMRYEDLCTQPRDTLARLWALCGVGPAEPPAFVRSSDHHVIGNSMRMGGSIEVRLDETWRAVLDDREERRVLEIAGPLHQRLGYV